MTITVVLWLQSGRRFEQSDIFDNGEPPRLLLRPMLKRTSMWGPPAALSASPVLDELAFELTDPAWASMEYRVGRRRFHYRETSGWRPREELEGQSLTRDRDARFQRIVDAIDKHQALLKAGAFPGEAPHPFAYQLPPDLTPGFPVAAADLKEAIELLKQLPILPESNGG